MNKKHFSNKKQFKTLNHKHAKYKPNNQCTYCSFDKQTSHKNGICLGRVVFRKRLQHQSPVNAVDDHESETDSDSTRMIFRPNQDNWYLTRGVQNLIGKMGKGCCI